MKNIFKLIVASLFVSILLVACNNDADRDWTTPEASFKLYDTSLGVNNVLYETMKGNPFTVVWESIGSGEYSVTLSSKEDFSSKTQLGTSTENSLTTTIGSLNAKLLELGFSPFVSQKLYIRIEKGSEVSNVISFGVTAYPVSGPVITAPANGSTITLNSADQAAIATTITWNDYSNYGSPVTYTVEIAKKGSATFSQLGVVTGSKSLAISNKDLNNAALTVGGVANTEGEFDFRVTAKTSFSTPAIELKSSVVTAKMKPYQVDYPDFYLVGGATAIGWDAPNSQKLYKKENTSEIYTYLSPDQFRFLGQKDWNPINYSIDDPRTDSGNRYFKTVSSNVEFGDHENMKFTGTAGIYHVKINADFGVKSLTVEPSAGVWDIPNLYLVGTTNGWQAASAEQFNPVGNGVFEIIKELPVGSEFKFLAQQDWSGKEWGNIHSTGNTGYLGPNGDNNNIVVSSSTSATNFYTIRVDLKRGTYQLIPF
ncbi:SusE domain-containing protein [Epilithonimonas sp.]|uniref:SusE domain-containing protein n=1 Tax=Epilithonimonas sp. TaxID=2894511 RepID=UPI0035AFD267